MNIQFPIRAIVLAAALSSATVATAHAAEPASTTTQTASAQLSVALELTIEVEKPELGADIKRAVEAEFDALRAKHGLTAAADAESADLVVRVRVWQPEPTALIIDDSVAHAGETLSVREGEVCMSCSLAEVASKSLESVPAAAEQVRAARAAAAPEIEAQPDSMIEEPASGAGPKRRLGPAGYIGIAASGVGLGAGIVGGLLLHRGKTIDGDPGAPTLNYTDYRPLGAGLLGAGLGVMVLGNVLLAVDLSILRDRREQRANARAQVTGVSVYASAGAGLAIHGRF